MVRVDANVLVLGVEREVADVQGLQLVVALQVGPSPHAAVYDVGKPLSVGDLFKNKWGLFPVERRKFWAKNKICGGSCFRKVGSSNFFFW